MLEGERKSSSAGTIGRHTSGACLVARRLVRGHGEREGDAILGGEGDLGISPTTARWPMWQ